MPIVITLNLLLLIEFLVIRQRSLVEALAKQVDRRIEVKYEIRDALTTPSF